MLARPGIRTLVLIVIALAILGFLYSNPSDIFTERSSSFSFDRFEGIAIGDSIGSCIGLLGPPLSISEAGACKNCKVFLFMGNYPNWVFGGTECWLLADENGVVVGKERLVEP